MAKTREEKIQYLREWRKRNPDAAKTHYRENQEYYRKKLLRWREENRESVREYDRAYYAKNADKKKAGKRRYRQTSKQVVNATNRKWIAKNPEKRKAIEKRYGASHPWIGSVKSARRRARKLNAPGTHTVEDIRLIWDRQNHKCAVHDCRYPISDISGDKHRYHVDHIIPLTHPDGTNWRDNLQILCSHHNRSKWALGPEEWAKRLLEKSNIGF